MNKRTSVLLRKASVIIDPVGSAGGYRARKKEWVKMSPNQRAETRKTLQKIIDKTAASTNQP